MDIPLKQMFQWKTGNIAPSVLGVWYILLPFLAGGALNYGLVLFGLTFFTIGLIQCKSKPTVLASLFTALLGMFYFFSMMNIMPINTLWVASIALFAAVLVFEFGIFKFGPSTTAAKTLTIVPLTLLGFSLVLAFAGLNPIVKINWNQWLTTLNYLAVMVFCWVNVFAQVGYKPFAKKTLLIMNLMAFAAVLLSLVGIYQGSLFQW